MLLLQILDPSNSIAPIISAFFDKFETITDSVSLWLSVGKALGCIGAYIYIIKRFGSKIMTGETFNLSDIGYPVFIAFLLSVYTPAAKGLEEIFTSPYGGEYVSNTVGGIYNVISKNKASGEGNMSDGKKQEAAAAIELDDELAREAEELFGKGDVPEWASIIVSPTKILEKGYETMVDGINSAVMGAVTMLLEVAIVCCIAIMFFLAKLYITFLYIFGPFSIGMSLIPGFENSITNWFQKYIGYCLWMPIGATIANLTREVLDGIGNIYTAGGSAPILPSSALVALLIATAMLIVSMLAVPKIASNVLATSVGASSTMSKFMGATSLARSGAAVASGAVTGGAATMAAAAGSVASASSSIGSVSNNSSNPAQAPVKP